MLKRYGVLSAKPIKHVMHLQSRRHSVQNPPPSVLRKILERTTTVLDRKASQYLLPSSESSNDQRHASAFREPVIDPALEEGTYFPQVKAVASFRRTKSFSVAKRQARAKRKRKVFRATLSDFQQARLNSNAHKACLIFNSLSTKEVREISAEEFGDFLRLMSRGRSTYASTIFPATLYRFRLIANRFSREGEDQEFSSPLLLVLVLAGQYDSFPGLVEKVVGKKDPFYDRIRDDLKKARMKDYRQAVLKWLDQAFIDIIAAAVHAKNFTALKHKVLAARPFLNQHTGRRHLLTPNILHAYYTATLNRVSDRSSVLYQINIPSLLLFRMASPFPRALSQTYDLVIEHYLLQQDQQSSRSILLARKEAGYQPDTNLYLAMLRGYRASGNYGSITQAVRKDVDDLGLVGDVRIINALIALYGYERDPASAWSTFSTHFILDPSVPLADDLTNRAQPNAETFVRLLRGCVSSGLASIIYAEKIKDCLIMLKDQLVASRELTMAQVEVECATGSLEKAFTMLQYQHNNTLTNPFILYPAGGRNKRHVVKDLGRMTAMLFRAKLAIEGPEHALGLLLTVQKEFGISPVNKEVIANWAEWYFSQPGTSPQNILELLKGIGVDDMRPQNLQRNINSILLSQTTYRTSPMSAHGRIQLATSILRKTPSDAQLKELSPFLVTKADTRLVGIRMRYYAQRYQYDAATPGILWRIFQSSILRAGHMPRPAHIQSIIVVYLGLKKFMAAIWTLEKAQKRFNMYGLGNCYALISAAIMREPTLKRKAILLGRLRRKASRMKIDWDSKGLLAFARSKALLGNVSRTRLLLAKAAARKEAPTLAGRGNSTSSETATILFTAHVRRFALRDQPSYALKGQIMLASLLKGQETGRAIDVVRLDQRLRDSVKTINRRLRRKQGMTRQHTPPKRYEQILTQALKIAEENGLALQQVKSTSKTAEDVLSEYLLKSRKP